MDEQPKDATERKTEKADRKPKENEIEERLNFIRRASEQRWAEHRSGVHRKK